jgi:hypothetical protein
MLMTVKMFKVTTLPRARSDASGVSAFAATDQLCTVSSGFDRAPG